jgi:hypothetical protein
MSANMTAGGYTGTPNVNTGTHGTLITKQTLGAAAASIKFTTGLPGTYSKYVFELTDVIPSVSGGSLNARISLDGSTYKAGTSDYSTIAAGFGGTGVVSTGNTTTSIYIVGDNAQLLIGTTSNYAANGQVTLENPSNTNVYKMFNIIHMGYYDDGNAELQIAVGVGTYTGATSGSGTSAIEGVEFYDTAGNLAAGSTISMYGLP